MRLSIKPCPQMHVQSLPTISGTSLTMKKLPGLNHSLRFDGSTIAATATTQAIKPECIGLRWKEIQGMKNWEGLLDPLDDDLRREIMRYGNFVEAAYRSCDFEPSSQFFAKCKYSKRRLLIGSGYSVTGYRVTANLTATSSIRLPQWTEKVPSWISKKSSWIGYVAVCQDKRTINRLGRRDVVIALRGTATCLEWLENLRATLTPLRFSHSKSSRNDHSPMVESGFLSLYTSKNSSSDSLQDLIRNEVARILEIYGDDEPLSFTFTGHSLGAALATLAAYDIKETFPSSHPVTVVSFGGPRVGNQRFRLKLEEQGTKVLRIVNSDDIITKMPGFIIDKNEDDDVGINWIQRWMKDTRWVYDDVGCELRLSSQKNSLRLLSHSNYNIAACHELKTYLGLVDSFVSSNCPLTTSSKRVSSNVNLGF